MLAQAQGLVVLEALVAEVVLEVLEVLEAEHAVAAAAVAVAAPPHGESARSHGSCWLAACFCPTFWLEGLPEQVKKHTAAGVLPAVAAGLERAEQVVVELVGAA